MNGQQATNDRTRTGRRGWGMRGMAFTTLVASVVSVVVFASPAAAGSARLHPKVCGNVSGPHWSFGGGSGTQYSVYAVRGASCSVALHSAPRLVGQRPHQPNKRGADLTGPSGWSCLSTAGSMPHSGYCVSGNADQAPVFGWGPFLRHP
jgi:hypothetical protein